MDVKQLRRENLLSLLGQYPRRDLCQRTGLATSEISALVAGRQELSERTARQIEANLGLPKGWMDLVHSPSKSQAEGNPEALPLDEHVLLAKFRQLNPTEQVHVRAIIDAFLAAKRTAE